MNTHANLKLHIADDNLLSKVTIQLLSKKESGDTGPANYPATAGET